MAMTDFQRNAVLEAIRQQTRAMTATREAANAALVLEGVYTSEGILAPEFGGPQRLTAGKPDHT